jgi:hypothetical protein
MLEREARRRPQSADVLRRELETFLASSQKIVSDHDLGEWMKATFPDRLRERLDMERACVAEMRGEPKDKGSGQVTLASTRVAKRREADGVDAAIGSLVIGDTPSHTATPTMATVLHRKSVTRSTSAQTITRHQGAIVGAVLVLCMLVVGTGFWYLGGERSGRRPLVSAAAAVGPIAQNGMSTWASVALFSKYAAGYLATEDERTDSSVENEDKDPILAASPPMVNPLPVPVADLEVEALPSAAPTRAGATDSGSSEREAIREAYRDRVQRARSPRGARAAVNKTTARSVDTDVAAQKRAARPRRRPKTDNIDPWSRK